MARNRPVRARTVVAVIAVAAATMAGATAAQAVIGGDESATEGYRFAARVQIGEQPGRACTGVLVAPQWILTATSCFTVGARPATVGAPPERTTVTVGRPDLTGAGGRVLGVTRLVPHADRDALLARLAAPVTDVAPVRLAATAPRTGEQARVLGFGRTATQWVPDHLHGATVTVSAVGAATIDLAPVEAGAAVVCRGDAGGPTLRLTGGTAELIGIHHSSGQQGCLGADGTGTGAVDTRVDDLRSWINGTAVSTCNAHGGVVDQAGFGAPLPDFTGDCRADIIHQNVAGELHGWRGSGDLSADGRLFTGSPTLVGGGWTTANVPRIILGDWDGDGRTDITRQLANGDLIAWASSGDFSADNLLFPRPSYKVGAGWTTTGVPRILTGDFNGDGRTDIAAVYANGQLRAFPSTGVLGDSRLFVGQGSLHSRLGLTAATFPRVWTGDFDGDGRADLAGQRTDGKVLVWRSTGDLSGPDTLFTGAGAIVGSGSGWTTTGGPRILTGDFTGEGRTDVALVYSDGRVRVWASTGVIADSKLWTGQGSLSSPGFTTAAYPRLLTGDADGDGRTDIVAHTSAGLLHAWRSSGDASGPDTIFPRPSRLVGSGWRITGYPRVF